MGNSSGPRPVKNDLTGRKFGQLLVLERADRYISPRGQASTQYKCRCDCGKETVVAYSALVRGQSKSCGCLGKRHAREAKIKGHAGEKYGMLTLIELQSSNTNDSCNWLCRCDCGKEIIKSFRYIKRSRYPSCGCAGRTSHGEQKIAKALTSKNIDYIRNSSLCKLVDYDTSMIYNQKFDFIVISDHSVKLIIEYDGTQHFYPTKLWQDNAQVYTRYITNDDIKNDFCRTNRIPLLRIKYTQEQQIEDMLDFAINNTQCFINRLNPYMSDREYYQGRVDAKTVNEYLEGLKTKLSKYSDHLGNCFPTITEMCKHWNVKPCTFTYRIKRGWSVQEALTLSYGYQKLKNNQSVQCCDHLGKAYSSLTRMAQAYGLTKATLSWRLQHLWPIEKALTHPIKKKRGAIQYE